MIRQINFPNAIQDEKDFYGRRAELQHIEDVLRSNQRAPVLVMGERRFGKTSIQKVMLQRLCGGNPPAYIPLTVEPRGIRSLEEFVRAIFIRLCSITGRRLNDSGLVNASGVLKLEAPEQFEPAFLHLMEENFTGDYLICVDEFDEIMRSVDQNDKISGLIVHVMENTHLPIKFFFTITSMQDCGITHMASPFISQCELIRLPLLETAEIETMVKEITSGYLSWDQASLDWLYRKSGGHPYFTKLLLANMWEEFSGAAYPVSVDKMLLQKAEENALEDPRSEYAVKNLYDLHFSQEEKELLITLAQHGGAVSGKQLRNVHPSWLTTARTLARRGYLWQADDYFDFKIEFLRVWLLHWEEFEEEVELFTNLRHHLAESVEIEIDEKLGQVRLAGRPVKVSTQEFRILVYLAERNGKKVDREGFIEAVWNEDGVSDQMVDAAISRLRNKLNDSGQYIETLRGQGYIMHRAVLIKQ